MLNVADVCFCVNQQEGLRPNWDGLKPGVYGISEIFARSSLGISFRSRAWCLRCVSYYVCVVKFSALMAAAAELDLAKASFKS